MSDAVAAGPREAAVEEILASAEVLPGAARVVDLTQLQGGWSRHTYVAVAESGSGAERREFVLRVRPAGGVLDTDLEQEFRLFEALAATSVPVPAVHAIERSGDNPFGGPFFVMDRVVGDAPNVWRGRDRSALEDDWSDRRAIATSFCQSLAAIHGVDVAAFEGVVVSRSYAELVDHWHAVQKEAELVADPVLDEAYAWARTREPEPVAPALVHGDYRIGNTLLAAGVVRAVLDWELAFLGDPRFDLAYMALPYHAGKFARPGSPLLCAVAEHDWFYDLYARVSGRDADREAIRTLTVVGGLMLIAIFATGIRAYERGETRDVRLPWGRFALPGLRQDLTRLIDW